MYKKTGGQLSVKSEGKGPHESGKQSKIGGNVKKKTGKDVYLGPYLKTAKTAEHNVSFSTKTSYVFCKL